MQWVNNHPSNCGIQDLTFETGLNGCPLVYIVFLKNEAQIFPSQLRDRNSGLTVLMESAQTAEMKINRNKNKLKNGYASIINCILKCNSASGVPLQKLKEKLKTNLMFKILKGHTPSYLQNLFSLRGTRYNFRNSEVKLNLPKPRTNFLKRRLSYSGARLWNSLPQDIRMIPLLSQFKKATNDHYNNSSDIYGNADSHTAIL